MRDLFEAPPHINGHRYDLFGTSIDMFRWMVGIFRSDGAMVTIRRANQNNLATYYPIRWDRSGEPKPLFQNYLFIEFQEHLTLEICRATTKFIKVIGVHDEDGILRPMLIRRNAIDENKAMVLAGKFNERGIQRRFYGKGSIVA
jgi:hypothetical protein